MRTLIALFLAALATASLTAQKMTAPQLITLAQSHSPILQDAINATFTPQELKEGTAWAGQGHDFFFALQSTTLPQLFIDRAPGPPMQPLGATGQWYAVARIEALGVLHAFDYQVSGTKFGGRLDLPAFGPDSYLDPGVPSGKLSEKLIYTSKLYDGMKTEYWVYVPAGYDPKVPVALMVFQDGGGYIHRDGNNPALNIDPNSCVTVMITWRDWSFDWCWRSTTYSKMAFKSTAEGSDGRPIAGISNRPGRIEWVRSRAVGTAPSRATSEPTRSSSPKPSLA